MLAQPRSVSEIACRLGGAVLYEDEDYLSLRCCRFHVFSLTHRQLLGGTWCRRCYVSAGEQAVARCLERLNVDSYREYTFPELRYVQALRLDFYVPSLRLVVEFDGISHYRPRACTLGSGLLALRRFRDALERDRIKDEWCERGGTSLLRIPFWRLGEAEALVTAVVGRCRSGETVCVDESREWRVRCLRSLRASGTALPYPGLDALLAAERPV
jgi:hypothetical protein